MDIHISDVRTFRQCRRKWNFSSPLRMNLEPTSTYAPFFMGRAVHHCLELYYSPEHIPLQDSLDQFIDNEEKLMAQGGELWTVEKDMIEEQAAMSGDILYHYELWYTAYKGSFNDKDLEFISLEQEFEVPLRYPSGRRVHKFQLAGRFDGVVKVKSTGEYWIWETKTTRSIKELTQSLANDEQAGAYLYAAQLLLGIPIAGVLYNIIRKKAPTSPRVNQDGTLSKNKSIDTTAAYYFIKARENHPDWSVPDTMSFYNDILNHLALEGKTFFARVPVRRSPFEIDQLSTNLVDTAREMVNKHTPLYPSPNWYNCNFCSFRSPCLAMNAGILIDNMLDAEYRTRQASVSMRTTEEETIDVSESH